MLFDVPGLVVPLSSFRPLTQREDLSRGFLRDFEASRRIPTQSSGRLGFRVSAIRAARPPAAFTSADVLGSSWRNNIACLDLLSRQVRTPRRHQTPDIRNRRHGATTNVSFRMQGHSSQGRHLFRRIVQSRCILKRISSSTDLRPRKPPFSFCRSMYSPRTSVHHPCTVCIFLDSRHLSSRLEWIKRTQSYGTICTVSDTWCWAV